MTTRCGFARGGGDRRASGRRAAIAAAAASVLASLGAGAADPAPPSEGDAGFQTPSPPNREAGLDARKWMRDTVANHVAFCWDPVEPREHPIEVRIRMQLDIDGALIGEPTIEASSPGEPDEARLAAARQSALAAILECAPYEFLPRERYQDWREIDMTFLFRAAPDGP